jgi:aryl-alcohol dehydrogenase-like predicted oxidoreductase
MSNEVRRLGRSGFDVTALGLGSFQVIPMFGVSEEEAAAVFALAAENGVGYVDTAPMYQTSEELLGRALAAHPSWAPVLSTKVGYFDPELGDDAYRDRAVIRQCVFRSCERLGRDRLDIVMVHEPEWAQWGLTADGHGAVLDALGELREEGVIGAIGLGGWGTERIAQLLDGGMFDVALVAGGFTLLDQPLRDHMFPAAERQDVGIVAGGAFGQGIPWLLSADRAPIEKMLRNDEVASPDPQYPLTRETAEKLLDLYDLADELGIGMTDLTIRYLLAEPRIHSHIAGAREAAHLRANLAAVAAGPLPAAAIARIEAR